MIRFKASQVVVGLGSLFLATGAMAAEKLSCPAGTKQAEFVSDGSRAVHCVRTDASGAQVKHGPALLFHPNGKLAAQGQFANGFRTGTWVDFDERGIKLETTETKDGELHGKVVRFHENGQVKSVEQFVHSVRDGQAQEFSAAGELVRTTQYKAGRAVNQ